MSRFYRLRLLKVLFVLAFLFTLVGAGPAQAQAPSPGGGPEPQYGAPAGPPVPGAVYDEEAGQWFMPAAELPEDAAAAGPAEVAAPSSPDQFGYTYDDAVAYSWKDAVSGGTNTGLTSSNTITGAVALPFTFNFYENAYSSVYISAYGYLTFTGGQYIGRQSPLLLADEPNNLVAPFWGPHLLNNSGTDARVFYKTSGSAPNRTFIVQWNKVRDYENTYTFEAILHENGDIVFQYNTMNYQSSRSCTAAGIEDSRASDGLISMDFCGWQGSNDAVRFTRPPAGGKMLVTPTHDGQFTAAGQTSTFIVTITNTGSSGADCYDLAWTGGSWQTTFINADTGAPLVDTDASFNVDTGPVPAEGVFRVGVNIQAPPLLNVGDSSKTYVTVSSTLPPYKSKTIDLSLAAPVPFSAAFAPMENNAVQLDYVEPGGSKTVRVSAESIYGYDPAAAESPSGNILTVWSESRCLSSSCDVYVRETKYSVRDRAGNVVKGVSTLASLSAVTNDTYDYYPAVAAAPNGTFGVAWMRRIYTNSGANYNIYFQRLSEAGALQGAPVKVTSVTSYNSVWMYNPAIGVSGSNFFIAWEQDNSSYTYEDIYLAVYSTSGSRVLAPKKVTADTSNVYDEFSEPSLTGLTGDRMLLIYRYYKYDASTQTVTNRLRYQVMNSAGTVTKAEAVLFEGYGYQPDAVQLSTGEILVAWQNSYIYYQLFNSTTFANLTPVQAFYTGLGINHSVTTDSSGHGIFGWADNSSWMPKYLYYAAIDHTGTVLTEPMIFESDASSIEVSSYGGWVASHQVLSTTAGVDLTLSGSTTQVVPSGGIVVLAVNLKNLGETTATNTVLSASIPGGVAVIDGSPAPTCGGGSCTWSLGDLDFLANGVILLKLQIPPDPVGTQYTVDFAVTCDESVNDDQRVTLISGVAGYVPLIVK